MCSPHDSSLWVRDWKKLYSKIKNPVLRESMQWPNQGRMDGASYNWHKNNKAFWSQLLEQIPHIKQIILPAGKAPLSLNTMSFWKSAWIWDMRKTLN